MAIILGIVLFMILIIIHELGHFIAAKKAGVKVLEFGIGIPPKLFKIYTDKSGTEYTVNLIPLGGFVKLKGENPEDKEEFKAPDSFMGVSLWRQLVILLGGITMNIIFAWLLFAMIFTIGIKPMQVLPKNAIDIESNSYLIPTYDFLAQKGFVEGEIKDVPVKILDVLPDMLASKAGIQSGDVITKINDQNVYSTTISDVLKDQIGKNFVMTYQRDGQDMTAQITCPDDGCLLGIVHDQGGTTNIKEIKFDFFTSLGVSAQEMYAQSRLTYHLLGKLVVNLVSGDKVRVKSSVSKLSGPVGAVKMGELILNEFGILHFISFAAMISLALGIFNVLPIPALDGGRTLSILIQSLFKLPEQKYFQIENYVNVVFFVLLLGFGVYVIMLDLVRFWGLHIPYISG